MRCPQGRHFNRDEFEDNYNPLMHAVGFGVTDRLFLRELVEDASVDSYTLYCADPLVL